METLKKQIHSLANEAVVHLRGPLRTALLDAAKVGEPAYSLGPQSVSPLRRLAGGSAPSDPREIVAATGSGRG